MVCECVYVNCGGGKGLSGGDSIRRHKPAVRTFIGGDCRRRFGV